MGEVNLLDRAREQKKSCLPAIVLLAMFCIAGTVVSGLGSMTAGVSGVKIFVIVACVCLIAFFAIVFRRSEKFFINLLAAIFVGWLVCTAAFAYYGVTNKPVFIIVFGILLLAAAAGYLALTRQLTTERAVWLIIAAGMMVKLGYILYTNVEGYGSRQHDVEVFSLEARGHAGYILYLQEYNQLPAFNPFENAWQFYHPPLHHIIGALWLDFQNLLGITGVKAYEGLQYLSLFYSGCCVIVAKRIFEVLKLKGIGLIAAMLVMSFSPAFILFAGSVNNDVLSVLFLMAAFLAVIKWAVSEKRRHLLLTALFIGLGMSTKLSAAYIAVPVGVLMLLVLLESKKENIKKLLVDYGLFAVIVFPLGLWWQIYNSIKFKIPFMNCFAVPNLGTANPQYVGYKGFFERFLPFAGMGDTEFFRWGPVFEYNAWSGLFKSSAFGEYSTAREYDGFLHTEAVRVTPVLFALTLAVCLLAFAAMVFYAVKRSGTIKLGIGRNRRVLIFGLYIMILASYLIFCVSYPHTCTMNIRYATPLIFIGAFFLGKFAQDMLERREPGGDGAEAALSGARRGVMTAAGVTVLVICTLYAVFSGLVYTLLAVKTV